MGVQKNEHGVYHARRKVPPKLEEAVAKVLGASKSRVSWLKKSLGTKDAREANIRSKPVLMEFDAILARAEALLEEVPLRTSLSDREIEAIANYHGAFILRGDER
jgi:hypothetical protein